MRWQVRVSQRAVKNLQKLPVNIQERFKALAMELRATGPVQRRWPHYGKIQGSKGLKIVTTAISNRATPLMWPYE